MQEEVEAVGAEVAQTPAPGERGIEHPRRAPRRIARGRRSVEPEVEVRQRAEAPLTEHPARASDERLVALRQRDRDERLPRRRLGRDGLDVGGADAHGLFHHERVAVVQQVLRRLGHARVRAERDDEVRPRLLQHRAIVREHRRPAQRGRAAGGDRGVGIVQADELDVVHPREHAQVGGVVERVPVADLDRDADSGRHVRAGRGMSAAHRSRTGSTSSAFAGARLKTTRATPASR